MVRRGTIAIGCLILLWATRSFAATQVSNLSEPYTVGFTANGVHFAHASSFVTDGASFTLQSVTVAVRTNSSGTSELRLRADSAGSPGALLESLGTQSISGDVLLTYNSVGTPLSANTRYWVTLGETGSGDFTWKGTTSTAETSPGAWTIGNDDYNMTAGSGTWTPTNFGPPNESSLFSVDAIAPVTGGAYYSVSGGGAQLVIADAPRPLQAATGTGTMFPPLLIPPNPNPGKALIKQTSGPDPKRMTIPPGVLKRKAPGAPAFQGIFKRNSNIWQVRTRASFSAPAAKFGTAVFKAGGRTGAPVTTFPGPGGTRIRYSKKAAQFGGPAQVSLVPLTAPRIWARAAAFSAPPCKHPKFGGAQNKCVGFVFPDLTATLAAPGAKVGFIAMSPGTPLPPGNFRALSVPNTTGLIAQSASLGNLGVTPNKATSAGFPWTTGRVTISAPSAQGAIEKFVLTGKDSRVSGAGTISLVSGSVSVRQDTGPNANSAWLRLTVPEPGAFVGAAAALATLAVCHALTRHARRTASKP